MIKHKPPSYSIVITINTFRQLQNDGVFLTLMINKIESRVISKKVNMTRRDLSPVLILNWRKIGGWELSRKRESAGPKTYLPRRNKLGKIHTNSTHVQTRQDEKWWGRWLPSRLYAMQWQWVLILNWHKSDGCKLWRKRESVGRAARIGNIHTNSTHVQTRQDENWRGMRLPS